LKRANRCFVCGEANSEGFRLKFKYDPVKISAECTVRIASKYQGATGFAHGGIIATLLDEAMAKTNGMGGIRAVTLRISVSYRRMTPVKQPLKLVGWRTSQRGRKLYLHSELRSQQNVLLADARGLFLAVPDCS
jgi:acyl-coenzyme A thioesterase PaaI-like protein